MLNIIQTSINFFKLTVRFHLIVLLLLVITSFIPNFAQAANRVKTVAITQIVAHDSLNKVRDGIIFQLKQKYGNRVNIELSNANGSIVTASQIAAKLVASKPDLIIAIATPSAQTVLKSAQNSNIPLLFASVSDPLEANLVADLQQPGDAISGTRNSSPLEKQLILAKDLIPHLKNLGIITCMSEANSVSSAKKLKVIAKEYEVKVQTKSVTNSGDVKLAAESLAGKVDAFFLLQDNTVASSLTALIKVATNAKKPIISSYAEAVKLGALAGLAYDEYQIGKQTGGMAIRVLEGAKIHDMPIEDPKVIELVINQKVARKLNINLPTAVIAKADKLF
jgi:putative ABC transport system substrate-binding protein